MLRGDAYLHGAIIGREIEVDQNRLLAELGLNGGKVDGQRSGAHSAFRAKKTVDFAESAFPRSRAPGCALQTGHRVPEFTSLQRLDQKIVRAAAHAREYRLAVGVIVRGNYIKIGYRLLHLLNRPQSPFRIRGKVGDQRGGWIPLQILQHPYIKVRSDFRILGDHFRIGER